MGLAGGVDGRLGVKGLTTEGYDWWVVWMGRRLLVSVMVDEGASGWRAWRGV